MAAPAFAYTIARAAELLGEDEELLYEIAIELEPEDGCLWIIGTGDQQTLAGLHPTGDGEPSRAPLKRPDRGREPKATQLRPIWPIASRARKAAAIGWMRCNSALFTPTITPLRQSTRPCREGCVA